MANVKISALPRTVDPRGADIPVVQGGVTKKVSLGALRGPEIDMTWFTPTVDPTDAAEQLQLAIDYAQTLVGGTGGLTLAPTIVVPPGEYSFKTSVTLKSCHIRSSMPNVSTIFYWDGAAGATVFTKGLPYAGATSYWLFEGIDMVSRAHEPDIWLNITSPVDNSFRLRDLGFVGGRLAIKGTSWINAHWYNLRFDSQSGYAIEFVPVSSANMGSFTLQGFTYDHGTLLNSARVASPGSGVFHINNTANFSNLGTFCVRDGRIEVNVAWTGGKSIFKVTKPSGGNAATVGMSLYDVDYQDVTGTMTGDCIVYHSTTSTTSYEFVTIVNSRFEAMSTIVGGTWPSYFPTTIAPPVKVAFMVLPGWDARITSGGLDLVLTNVGSIDYGFTIRGQNETFRRFLIDHVGQIYFGNSGVETRVISWDGTNMIVKTGFKVEGTTLGFFNATPTTKPTVTGSRGGNAALASLLTALANLGLITDSST